MLWCYVVTLSYLMLLEGDEPDLHVGKHMCLLALALQVRFRCCFAVFSLLCAACAAALLLPIRSRSPWKPCVVYQPLYSIPPFT
jgi:hypothetical protein